MNLFVHQLFVDLLLDPNFLIVFKARSLRLVIF